MTQLSIKGKEMERKNFRTYKRKLILSNAQESRLRSWLGACRIVYNLGLEIKQSAYQSAGVAISKYELMRQLPDLRKDFTWIEDVPAQILQHVIFRLDKGFQKFFSQYKSGVGFPRFASKKRFKSFEAPSVKLDGDKIRIMKIGWIKFFKDEPILGTPKTAQIIIEPTGLFICIKCENVPPRFESESQAVGLDMGISHFCIDSNGNFIANPKHFKKYERRLRIENRSLARKKKFSNGWKKQAKKLALLHHKIGNVRKDFLHKESTAIAKGNSVVYMENLNISGMTKNRNLSKHILDAGWGIFRTMLKYKTNVVLIDPKYTSQTCNECGEKDAKSRISQSEFVCTNCGHVSNADVNAAKNILSKGIALSR